MEFRFFLNSASPSMPIRSRPYIIRHTNHPLVSLLVLCYNMKRGDYMKDITGQRFGNLTVLKPDFKDRRGEWHWLCLCDCGSTKSVSGNKLRSGNTKSCGCLQREHRASGNINRTHGMTKSRLYYEWTNMKSRCYYAKNVMFHSYGGRGIQVCEEWKDSFECFMKWALLNGYEDNLTLERINVDANYCPENCKWIPRYEQCLNTRRNHFVTAFGRTQTIKEWSVESGIKYDTIERRLNSYGWDPEKAVSVPPTKHK